MIELPNNICKNMLVLFKNGHGWETGWLSSVELGTVGLWFSILDKNKQLVENVTANNIFFNARPLEEWEWSYLYSKEEFLQKIEDEEISPTTHNAWISDGYYAYYSVAKWNKNWLQKQPFEYVLCV